MDRDTVIVRQLGLILCLVLAFTLPFAGKAIHIDDVYFVDYSHHWGYLPWAPSQAPLETFQVFEVRGPARDAPGDPCASS